MTDHCERGSKKKTQCVKNWTSEEKQDTTRPHLLKRNSSPAFRPRKAHRSSKERMGRQRRSITRGFLRKCQLPACQGVPVATTDRSGRTQCQAKKTGNIEQTTANANMGTRNKKKQYSLPQRVEAKSNGASGVLRTLLHRTQDDVEVSVNNARQISPFYPHAVSGAFVLDGTNGYHVT